MVASFFKSIGRGIIYFFTVPVFLIALVIYAIICFFGFLFLMIKSIILFFKGKPLDYDLPEDIEAKKRLEMQTSPIYSNTMNNSQAQAVPIQGQPQININPYNQNNYQPQQNNNISPLQHIEPQQKINNTDESNVININENIDNNNEIIHEEEIQVDDINGNESVESISFDFEDEDKEINNNDNFNTLKLDLNKETKHENIDINENMSEKDHHISINKDEDKQMDESDDDNDSGVNISFGD